MKPFLSIVIATIIIGFSTITHAQEDFVIMSNPKNQFLLKGIENPIEFYCSFKIKEIRVIGGKIVFQENAGSSSMNDKVVTDEILLKIQKEGRFLLIPDCEANMVEVVLVGKKDSISKYFSSLRVPNPLVRFAGQLAVSNTISAPVVRTANAVFAYQAEDFVYTGLNYNTADFKVKITHEGKAEEFVCQGANLSVEVRVSLSKMQIGDRILIYDVNVTGECGLIHLEDRLDLLVQ